MTGVKIGGDEPVQGTPAAIERRIEEVSANVEQLRGILDVPSMQWVTSPNPQKPELGQRNRWEWFKDYLLNMVQNMSMPLQIHDMDPSEDIEPLKAELTSAIEKYEYRNGEFKQLRDFVRTPEAGLDSDSAQRAGVLLHKLEDQKNQLIGDIHVFTGQSAASAAVITR
jgi:hypothetical protein